MLLQFSASNYRAFREQQTLSMAAGIAHDKTLPGNCISSESEALKGSRWVKGVALYGANASGKSTLIHALKALARWVQTSAKTTDPKDPIEHIEPFALDPAAAEEPTAFTIFFVTSDVRYEYQVAATRSRVWFEALRAYPEGKAQTWFEREWVPEDGVYTFSPNNPTGMPRDPAIEARTLPNMLYLSKAVAENRAEVEPVFRWFKEGLVFFDLSTRGEMSSDATMQLLHKKDPLAERVIRLLHEGDTGVVDAIVKDNRGSAFLSNEELKPFTASERDDLIKLLFGELPPFEIQLMHRAHGGRSTPLDWNLESAGTQRLFSLAGPFLTILKRGQVACVDEMDTSLHPLLVRALLRLFFSETDNPLGAQILFTTHNPLLLDTTLLRRDQVWFTDKNDEGAAHLYPLTDYKPRQDEALSRGYMAGRYGGIPFIPDHLLHEPTEQKEEAAGA